MYRVENNGQWRWVLMRIATPCKVAASSRVITESSRRKGRGHWGLKCTISLCYPKRIGFRIPKDIKIHRCSNPLYKVAQYSWLSIGSAFLDSEIWSAVGGASGYRGQTTYLYPKPLLRALKRLHLSVLWKLQTLQFQTKFILVPTQPSPLQYFPFHPIVQARNPEIVCDTFPSFILHI